MVDARAKYRAYILEEQVISYGLVINVLGITLIGLGVRTYEPCNRVGLFFSEANLFELNPRTVDCKNIGEWRGEHPCK